MFLHIDIDSFFISAERTLNPKLLGVPAAVGSRSNLEIFNKHRDNTKLININSGAFVTPVFHNSHKRTFENYFVDKIDGKEKIRGIITTASYEARACGVKTAMPIAQAIKLCPEIIVVPSNYPLYHKLSRAIHIELKHHIPQIEQYSIDEFFGNLDGWVKEGQFLDFANNLKNTIYKKFKIPVSIGIAESKFIAKLATNKAKPFGVYVVENQKEFINDIPIEKFPGIGKGFSKKLHKYGIKTLGDVCNSKELLYRWKKPGIELFNRVCQDNNGAINKKEPKKSIGLGRTFDAIYEYNEIKRRLVIMARHIAHMVKKAKVNPLRYDIKIYYKDGKKLKAGESTNRVFSEQLLKSIVVKQLDNIWLENRGVIKLRVSVSNFQKVQHTTLSLLDYNNDSTQKDLDNAVTTLRERFGLDILKNGNEI